MSEYLQGERRRVKVQLAISGGVVVLGVLLWLVGPAQPGVTWWSLVLSLVGGFLVGFGVTFPLGVWFQWCRAVEFDKAMRADYASIGRSDLRK